MNPIYIKFHEFQNSFDFQERLYCQKITIEIRECLISKEIEVVIIFGFPTKDLFGDIIQFISKWFLGSGSHRFYKFNQLIIRNPFILQVPRKRILMDGDIF